jgi:microcystin-dependent protein
MEKKIIEEKIMEEIGLIGTIKLFAGDFAPEGYFTCEGQLLNVREYEQLYSVLGNKYGGNGRTTFGLPDLRGAFPTQCDNLGSATVEKKHEFGAKGGAVGAIIKEIHMPEHTHTIEKGKETNLRGTVTVKTVLQASTGAGKDPSPSATNSVLGTLSDASGNTPPNLYTNAAPNQNLTEASSTVSNTLDFDPKGLKLSPSGSPERVQQPLPTLPPFVAMQYIICVRGIYPTR